MDCVPVTQPCDACKRRWQIKWHSLCKSMSLWRQDAFRYSIERLACRLDMLMERE